jgi:MATE family multidrug resistance protein
VAVGQATISLISDYATKHDSARIRRSVRAGTGLALAVVVFIATTVIVLSCPEPLAAQAVDASSWRV